MRRIFLAALLLSACGGSGVFYEAGYWWELDPNAVPCPAAYEWIALGSLMVLSICGDGKIGCRLEHACQIVSMYTEPEAKLAHVEGTGESHWDHEMRHLRKQLRHPKGY